MKLSVLLESIVPRNISGLACRAGRQPSPGPAVWPDPDIGSIHYDSRDVKPGGLFVAIQGLASDGHDFIDDALTRGAAAVVVCRPTTRDAVVIEVDNGRKALAALADRFYGHPSRQLFVIGITGTNGKTTTAYLIESMLAAAGLKVGVIGTINYRYGGQTFNNPVTTPESADLQRILSQMAGAGVTHVVMEVSSHAIDLDRIGHCRMAMGVFTNLTQDHLDYHGSMDGYWACKKRLFTEHLLRHGKNGRPVAVINSATAHGRELLNTLPMDCISVGGPPDSLVRAEAFTIGMDGIRARILSPEGEFHLTSPLVGTYNLDNILCAVGAGIAMELPLETIKSGLQALTRVPGRLDPVRNGSGRVVYVDYAHTPDALENVLRALKPLTRGRIICLFGCGGDRDRQKRPMMGEIAARHSDFVLITSDNPRTEPPMGIIDQVEPGVRRILTGKYPPADLSPEFNEKGYTIEPDRKAAIHLAISMARTGDAVLIAGKGHEDYQIIGHQTIAFDDRLEAEKALAAK